MEKFKKYLILSHVVPEKRVKFYVAWVSKFYFSCYHFVKGKSPTSLNNTDVKDFMIHLAANKKVAPSTQNQAFNAI